LLNLQGFKISWLLYLNKKKVRGKKREKKRNMLEFFAVSALAQNMQNKKSKEDAKMKEFFEERDQPKVLVTNWSLSTNTPTINLISGLLALLISLYTANLAYTCNKKSDVVVRLLASLFGFFFSGIYLIYYFIRYIIMKQKC
jgi:hypothetical protein